MGAGLKATYLTPLTQIDTVAQEALGTLRLENGNWYKYVNIKNTTATVAGAAGSLVGWFAATGRTINRVVIDLSDADAIVIGAGALMGTVTGTLTVDYYGWIQLTGAVTLDTAVTSAAAGKSFFLSTTDKTGTVGANAYDQKLGISTNATTGAILTAMA